MTYLRVACTLWLPCTHLHLGWYPSGGRGYRLVQADLERDGGKLHRAVRFGLPTFPQLGLDVLGPPP
jgi:hypothetical protein